MIAGRPRRIILPVDHSPDEIARAALALARQAVERYVRTSTILEPPGDLPVALRLPAGVFVTLRLRDRLRGCVGTVTPARPDIARELVASAVAAACADPRFPPVHADELPELVYEVHVLSPLEAVRDLADLDPGVYGVLVDGEGRWGVLLPGLDGVGDAERQVAIARSKAGLPAGTPVTIHRFQVRRFRDPEP